MRARHRRSAARQLGRRWSTDRRTRGVRRAPCATASTASPTPPTPPSRSASRRAPAPVIGVRGPLVARRRAPAARRPLREASPSSALWLAAAPGRRARARGAAVRTCPACRRSCLTTPSGRGSSCAAWRAARRLDQRRLAGRASTPQGILAEPFRWAELEQLVYSTDRWERRLVGSTLARTAHRACPRAPAPRAGATRGLTLIGSLIGDAEPDVQKALSWALRSWCEVDPARRRVSSSARRPMRGHRTTTATGRGSMRDALTAARRLRRSSAEIRDRAGGHPAPARRAVHQHRRRGRRSVQQASTDWPSAAVAQQGER